MGLRIWGGQFVPGFKKGTMEPRHDIEVQKIAWQNMPENLDMLVTHTPPSGILDYTLNKEHIGCDQLLKQIRITPPKLHLFGHVHEMQQRSLKVGNITFKNCANLDRNYLLNYHKPMEILL